MSILTKEERSNHLRKFTSCLENGFSPCPTLRFFKNKFDPLSHSQRPLPSFLSNYHKHRVNNRVALPSSPRCFVLGGFHGVCTPKPCEFHCKAKGHPAARCDGQTCICRDRPPVSGRCLLFFMCRKRNIVINKNIIKVFMPDPNQKKTSSNPDPGSGDETSTTYEWESVT